MRSSSHRTSSIHCDGPAALVSAPEHVVLRSRLERRRLHEARLQPARHAGWLVRRKAGLARRQQRARPACVARRDAPVAPQLGARALRAVPARARRQTLRQATRPTMSASSSRSRLRRAVDRAGDPGSRAAAADADADAGRRADEEPRRESARAQRQRIKKRSPRVAGASSASSDLQRQLKRWTGTMTAEQKVDRCSGGRQLEPTSATGSTVSVNGALLAMPCERRLRDACRRDSRVLAVAARSGCAVDCRIHAKNDRNRERSLALLERLDASLDDIATRASAA